MPVNAPPLLVSFNTLGHYLKSLPDGVIEQYKEDIEKLTSLKLPPVVSVRALAVLFGLSPYFMGAIYRNSDRYYRVFSIPKGSGKRIIQAPKVSLKIFQKWIGTHLEASLSFPDAVFGFVRGKSAATAAAAHCGARWVFSFDIENFFLSTSIERVKDGLISLGYKQHGADIISKICSFRGFLAQGSPASPTLSNLIFRQVDKDLILLAKQHNVVYTRYADDIIFSGRDVFPEELREKAISIVEADGWKICEKKTHYAHLQED